MMGDWSVEEEPWSRAQREVDAARRCWVRDLTGGIQYAARWRAGAA